MNNKIIIREKDGADELELENDSIISCHINRPCDPSLSELAIGTLEAVLHISGFVEGFAPSDYPDGMASADGQTVYCRDADVSVLNSVKYGFDVLVYANDILIGIFYVKTITRTGPEEYTLMSQNWAGVMDDVVRHGAQFTGNYSILGNIISLLLLADQMPAFLRQKIFARLSQDALLNDIEVRYAYFFRGTLREQIQNLLFAYGAYIREPPDGSLVISPILGAVSSFISDDALYNAGTVEAAEQPNAITVREYTLSINRNFSEDSWELLFDNTEFGQSTDTNIVRWDGAPMSHIRLDSGPEYYSGQYFQYTVKGVHKLYGRRYLATYREITEINPSETSGDDIIIDSVLINPLNSNSVMRRLKAFYFSDRKVVKQDFVWRDENPGGCYGLTDSFGDSEICILGNSTLALSAVPKVSAEFHANWAPFSPAPFSHSVTLTGSGSWTVPDGVDAIQVVLVGGGSGGSSGLRGQNGESRKIGTWSNLVYGGDQGLPGTGGKIRTVTINNPDRVYNYSCGAGGAGGAVCSSEKTRNEGKPGKDTVFGVYSSAYGEVLEQGVKDRITGRVYGGEFYKTFISGKGVQTDLSKTGGATIYQQAYEQWCTYWKNQTAISGWLAPAAGDTTQKTVAIYDGDNPNPWTVPLHYSGPGGSAVKIKGGQRAIGSRKSKSVWILGDGGDGAAPSMAGTYPLEANSTYYGWGGGSGYGGGAGGASGFVPEWWVESDDPSIERFYREFVDKHFASGKGGKGGNGGAGGKGAPGCIIIYY